MDNTQREDDVQVPVANAKCSSVTTACMTKPLPATAWTAASGVVASPEREVTCSQQFKLRRGLLIRPCSLLRVAQHAAGDDERRSPFALHERRWCARVLVSQSHQGYGCVLVY